MERRIFDRLAAIHLLLSNAADLKRARAETATQEIGVQLDTSIWDLAGSQRQIANMLRRKTYRLMTVNPASTGRPAGPAAPKDQRRVNGSKP